MPSWSGLLHRVRRYYDFCFNIPRFAIKERDTQQFATWILLPVITKYVQPYFQLLVIEGSISDVWTSSCINLSYYSICPHQRPCDMHTIWCLHYVGENLEGNFKNGKISCCVISLYQFIQQANIHNSSEPNCNHFPPLTIQDKPFKAKLIWMIYIKRVYWQWPVEIIAP